MTEPPPVPEAARRAELAANLATVEERIAKACAAAGRRRDEVTLVVVTKTWPAADVRLLAELGVTDVGENRDQEARVKAAQCAELPLRWHFIGQLQRNKARSVAGYASLVHTVDRPALATALGAAAVAGSLPVLIQVSLEHVGRRPTDATASISGSARGGVPPTGVVPLADTVAQTDGLQLAGVMAVAPLGADPSTAFATLADVADVVRRSHPTATAMSAGMSGDLEAAVLAGATHLRLGTAVLGARPPER